MSTLTGKDLNLVKPELTDDYKVTIGTDLPANFQKIDDEFSAHLADAVKHITSAERTAWNNKAEISDIPTKVSQLENDAEYVTQIELERYKSVNDQAVDNLDSRMTTVENNKAEKSYVDSELSKKADKTYVDTELEKKANKSDTYTKSETDSRIQAIIGAAPEALDTLAEIAEALNNDPDFAATITNMLAQKVDKVAGMGLSEANFTNEEKTKLSTIEEGANKYIHPSTHPASMIVETSEKRFVSDIEKATWNAKETPAGAQEKANIAEANAKDYTDIHDQNTTKHITATERTNWNDANAKKHTHSNKSILDTITQTLINAWNSAVDHISDGASHSKTARFVVGTSTAGWTSADCDYLCDGTNDQEEIIQALNALPATGGEVVILDGTYNIKASINIPKDNVSIRGNGNATILKRMYNSTNTDSGSTARGLITLNEKSGCKIQGLQIDGNKATYTVSYNYGIYLTSSNNNTVIGNTCNNNRNGIYFQTSSNNTITGNTCNNNRDYGIYFQTSSNNTITGNTCNNNNYGIYLYSSNNNTITGNTCNNNDTGIYLDSSSDNTVTGNTCNNNDDTGIYLDSSSDNTITGNTYNNNGGGNGIYLDSSSDNMVTGNTCNNNGIDGIFLYSSSNNNTITDNTCNNNDGDGIYLGSSSNNTVTGNTCNNNGIGNGIGIYLYSSSNNTITGNTCNNNGDGIYLYSSSNNTITGNTCIRGTGQPSDYTSSQYTIHLAGSGNSYNLISSNNCMGKNVVIGGGTSNTSINNKYN